MRQIVKFLQKDWHPYIDSEGLMLKVQTRKTLENQMAQQKSLKIFSRNKYCTCGALKCKKAQKSSKMSIYNGNMRP
jgi:hypothetical protein